MKISLNKIRYASEHYGVADLVPDGIDALVQKIGAQLGGVDGVEEIGSRYEGIIIVKVVKCDKLEGSDHLNLCRIDDGGVVKDVERGDDGLVQVVCGAPNVAEGLLVAWLPPGSTVPASVVDGDPFVLEARELRGHKSNGMLASPQELAIGTSHEGLLIVDRDVKPGTTFSEAYRTNGEMVIEMENKMFTHRPDCFGVMGVTREIAGIQGKVFKSPDWYLDNHQQLGSASTLPLTVRNELPGLVPRFAATVLSGLTVKPSPIWLQFVLQEVGIRPINNIVDLTNFWMLETGQPLHAYDYDKVKALSGGDATIVVRNPKPGEKLTLLNGKEIEPRAEAIMIATDKQLIGLGGVMGGADTEVDGATTNIILECANFDMYSIRRTSMTHGIFTDAVTRFNKGQSPLQNLAVLGRITQDLIEQAGAQVAGPAIDDNHLSDAVVERNSLHPAVAISVSFINSRLGVELSAADITTLLENVEFKVEASGDELQILAPFWRTDIQLREDVVEEVGRLYGYDHLPLELPQRSLKPTAKNQLLQAKNQIRTRLSRGGANEILTYSFVHEDLLRKTGQDPAKAFKLSNALSPDLQYYRLSLMPSLLEKVHPNIKAGHDEFALFEIGKTHNVDYIDDGEGVPKEFEVTALVVTANDKLKKPGAALYAARKYLVELIGNEAVLEFRIPTEADLAYELTKPYDAKRSALVSVYGGEPLGIVGEFKPSVTRSLKLPNYTAGFELDTENLMKLQQSLAGKTYRPIPRFPKVNQDMSLKIAKDVADGSIHDLVRDQVLALRNQGFYAQFEYLDIYTNDTPFKHVTFSIEVASNEKTLTAVEVNKMLDAIAAAAKAKFGAERL
jgi:phenylalanyl-tRNA synthetase beta chain